MSNETLPGIDFSTLVVSLSQTALVQLGEAVHPDVGEKHSRNLDLARQTIDLLGILQEKTKGNLNGDEERLLDQVLYDLRMRFVEVSKESAKGADAATQAASQATPRTSKGSKG